MNLWGMFNSMLKTNKKTNKANVKEKAFMKGIKAFSIIEIIISLILLGIGILAVGQAYRAGRFLLRQSDNRSIAMNLASMKMEEYMSRTYEDLEDGEFNGEEVYPDNRQFDWNVEVEKRWEGEDDPLTLQREGIPYKIITVICSYEEPTLSRSAQSNEVRLINIVPYPAIHTDFLHELPDEASAPEVVLEPGRTVILPFDLRYETNKDLMIIYNITIKILDADGIGPIDTIYSECFFDGSVRNIITRTPIIMQPLISNVVGIENVTGDEDHSLQIRLYKDTAGGDIIIKEANLIVIATEHR